MVCLAAALALGCGDSKSDDDGGAGRAGSGGASGGGSGGTSGASDLCSLVAGQTGSSDGFPANAPVCPRGDEHLLRLEGSLAGIPVDIERTGLSGGYAAQEGKGGFQSPLAPDPTAFFIGLSWEGAGDVTPALVTGGYLTLPPGAVGEGHWSFREGQVLVAEDDARGDLLFSITSVVYSTLGVCESAPVWAELRGCWTSRAF